MRWKNTTISIEKKKQERIAPEITPGETPPIKVQGRIVNENKDPVAASISVKGTNKGISSDAYGNFNYYREMNATLVISAIGLRKRKKSDRRDVEYPNEAPESNLRKWCTRDIILPAGINTGAVATVGSQEIQTQPVTNPLVAIAGRMSGVNIQQTSGMPGSAMKIAIRGRNSIRNDDLDNGNLPLYVIDKECLFLHNYISSDFCQLFKPVVEAVKLN